MQDITRFPKGNIDHEPSHILQVVRRIGISIYVAALLLVAVGIPTRIHLSDSDWDKLYKLRDDWRKKFHIELAHSLNHSDWKPLSDTSFDLIKIHADSIFNMFEPGSLEGELWMRYHHGFENDNLPDYELRVAIDKYYDRLEERMIAQQDSLDSVAIMDTIDEFSEQNPDAFRDVLQVYIQNLITNGPDSHFVLFPGYRDLDQVGKDFWNSLRKIRQNFPDAAIREELDAEQRELLQRIERARARVSLDGYSHDERDTGTSQERVDDSGNLFDNQNDSSSDPNVDDSDAGQLDSDGERDQSSAYDLALDKLLEKRKSKKNRLRSQPWYSKYKQLEHEDRKTMNSIGDWYNIEKDEIDKKYVSLRYQIQQERQNVIQQIFDNVYKDRNTISSDARAIFAARLLGESYDQPTWFSTIQQKLKETHITYDGRLNVLQGEQDQEMKQLDHKKKNKIEEYHAAGQYKNFVRLQEEFERQNKIIDDWYREKTSDLLLRYTIRN